MYQQTVATQKMRRTRTQRKRIEQRLFRRSANDELPVTVKHERIYILPTKRGLAFLCVLAIMLIAAINYGLNLGYALCFILVGLFFSCLLATYQNLVQLQFNAITASDTFEGSALSYKVTIADRYKRGRSSITLGAAGATDVIDIEASGSSNAILTIKKPHRGIHSLGRITVSSDYPLGLWRGWGYIHAPTSAYVYPKPEKPCVEFASILSDSDKAKRRSAGEQEYSGLKSYETTDSPARIAWKRVAAGTGWYSKQFSAQGVQSEVAIRWSDTPSNQSVEQRLSRMCAWVVKAKDENTVFSFELPTFDAHKSDRGSEFSKSCLRALAAFGQTSNKLENS